MNPVVKKLWLEALRSGEYSQTQSYLHTKEGHCCLGVLSEVACKSGEVTLERKWSRVPIDDEGFGDFEYEVFGTDASFLDGRVAAWAGLPNEGPRDNGESIQHELASMNDDGATFEEIADHIEEYL